MGGKGFSWIKPLPRNEGRDADVPNQRFRMAQKKPVFQITGAEWGGGTGMKKIGIR